MFRGPAPTHYEKHGFPVTIGKKRKTQRHKGGPVQSRRKNLVMGRTGSFLNFMGPPELPGRTHEMLFSCLFPLHHSHGHMSGGIYGLVSPFSNFVYLFTDPGLFLLPILTTHKCVPAVGCGLRTHQPTGTWENMLLGSYII